MVYTMNCNAKHLFVAGASSIDCYACNGVADIEMCPTSACTTKCFSMTTPFGEETSTARGCFEKEADFEGT